MDQLPETGFPDASGGALPVHGFVLAGGKSSRMGRDKATLRLGGRTMVEIAVEKLRGFCAAVSIAGNREDLSSFAPVVRESRVDAGPAAGIEAGLMAAAQPWAMFVPVDVPLLPAELLRRWADDILASGTEGCRLSFLQAGDRPQPSICLLRRECLAAVSVALEERDFKLLTLFERVGRYLGSGSLRRCRAETFAPKTGAAELEMKFWFSNVNTPQELAEAEVWGLERG